VTDLLKSPLGLQPPCCKNGRIRGKISSFLWGDCRNGERHLDKKSVLKGVASITKSMPIAKIADTTIEAVDSIKWRKNLPYPRLRLRRRLV
jgi:hypothetical protein